MARIIETERLLLRPIVSSDLENIYKGLSHPDVIKYYGVSYDSMEATLEQMKWYASLEKEETGAWWAICRKDDAVFLGAAGLNYRSAQHNKAEIGFWLLPEYQGMGIIREAVPLVCAYGFTEMGLHRIEAWIETENDKSRKAVSALGFQHEGTLKENELKNGRYISLSVYALLRQHL